MFHSTTIRLYREARRVRERIARNNVIDQLHRNRGALRTLYPRDARTVRSFFPPGGRSGTGGAEGSEGESGSSGAEGGVAPNES